MSNQKTAKQVIFGTGPLALAVMDQLATQGKPVTLVNRSGKLNAALPAGVTIAAADATDPAQVRQVCTEAAVVYLCAMPPYTQWPEKFPPLIQGLVTGLAGSGVKLIYGDNLYMYGPNHASEPITEGLPHAATGPKGRTRAAMAKLLLDAHARGDLRVSIGRAPDFYGPRVLNSVFGAMFLEPALAGKPVNLIGDIDQPHTFTYIHDFGRALVTLGDHDEALGRAWHVPSAPTMTQRQLVDLFSQAIGKPIKVRAANKALLTALGWFNPMIREAKEMYDSFKYPYTVDHSQFAGTFGATPTPHEEAVLATVAWYRKQQ
ncbi:MAG: NAD-dependent epimerase/dehydratase family protein [Chloroflexota bacterium]|nr:NAD-dependent epimerase/dehydratase family protein [Chloroflexota bacterium]